MGFLPYHLYIDIARPLSPHNHYIVEVLIAILHVYLVFAVISLTFPDLSKLLCVLDIPWKPPKSLEKQLTHSPELRSRKLDVVKMLVSFLLSLFFIHFKVKKANSKLQPVKLFYCCLSLDNYYFYTHFSAFLESIIVDFLGENDQAQNNIKLFAWVASIPCRYYLEIISILLDPVYKIVLHLTPQFNFSKVQYFWSLKSKFFSFRSNDNLPFSFSWYFAKSWHYTKLFFWLWASIYCLLGDCCYCLDNFSTAISISCGFICCYYYYIWGDVWCHFQILFRNATSFSYFISFIWCTAKLSLCKTAWIIPPRFSFWHVTVRLLLPGSLKQNWPIRLQDKNNKFQPKPTEPITSRRKTTVKTQHFGIIHRSYHNVIWLANFKWPR